MKQLIVVLFAMALTACGSTPQSQVALDSNFYQSNQGVVGVYFDKLPEVDTWLPGADCLLCYAAAAAMNARLSSHFQSLDAVELEQLKDELLNELREKGMEVKSIQAPIKFSDLKSFKTKELNFAKKDHRPLKEKLGVDHLIVIDFNVVGAVRYYSGYVPNGPPTGKVSGLVYMVDLATNQYQQYNGISVSIAAQGEWDEPPTFPGLTNAYYQAIEQSKDRVKEMFK